MLNLAACIAVGAMVHGSGDDRAVSVSVQVENATLTFSLTAKQIQMEAEVVEMLLKHGNVPRDPDEAMRLIERLLRERGLTSREAVSGLLSMIVRDSDLWQQIRRGGVMMCTVTKGDKGRPVVVAEPQVTGTDRLGRRREANQAALH